MASVGGPCFLLCLILSCYLNCLLMLVDRVMVLLLWFYNLCCFCSVASIWWLLCLQHLNELNVLFFKLDKLNWISLSLVLEVLHCVVTTVVHWHLSVDANSCDLDVTYFHILGGKRGGERWCDILFTVFWSTAVVYTGDIITLTLGRPSLISGMKPALLIYECFRITCMELSLFFFFFPIFSLNILHKCLSYKLLLRC